VATPIKGELYRNKTLACLSIPDIVHGSTFTAKKVGRECSLHKRKKKDNIGIEERPEIVGFFRI
jgi:hypothetical protein